jgi:hypothetical protein
LAVNRTLPATVARMAQDRPIVASGVSFSVIGALELAHEILHADARHAAFILTMLPLLVFSI